MQKRSRFTRGPERLHVGAVWRQSLCAVATATLVGTLAAEDGRRPLWREAVSGIEFVRIEAGCFTMGEPEPGPSDDGMPFPVPRVDETPAHRVCLDHFWLSRLEVTKAQWHTVMAAGQAPPGDSSMLPVTEVSWHEARDFADRLGRLLPGATVRFRLPSEAEWEYACWAGGKVPARQLHGEDRLRHLAVLQQQAWFNEPPGWMPVPRKVGARQSNAWGLYDMLGNVWEWTADAYEATGYAHHAARNPRVDSLGGRRVVRGGSAKSDGSTVRCGARNSTEPEDRSPVIGFRIVAERP